MSFYVCFNAFFLANIVHRNTYDFGEISQERPKGRAVDSVSGDGFYCYPFWELFMEALVRQITTLCLRSTVAAH